MYASKLLRIGVLVTLAVAVFATPGWPNDACVADSERAAALGQQVDELHAQLSELRAEIERLAGGLQGVERKTACMSSEGGDTFFTGCNLHVRDGTGDTDGPTNGLGNLIIGYNETFVPGARRTGSHNLVIGPEHSYTSYGGFVAGFYNTVSAPHASVSGGAFNTAAMNRAAIGGGERNKASGLAATVSGGADNHASAEFAAVSGGYRNAAGASYASVAGGAMNNASAHAASVGGGSGNEAAGTYAAVGGGELNLAAGANASIGGGMYNRTSGAHAHIGGGRELVLSESFSVSPGLQAATSPNETSTIPGKDAGEPPGGERHAGSQAMRASVAGLQRSAPVVPVDHPFKLPDRDFNPRAHSPLDEP
jgi:hypothetical protein